MIEDKAFDSQASQEIPLLGDDVDLEVGEAVPFPKKNVITPPKDIQKQTSESQKAEDVLDLGELAEVESIKKELNKIQRFKNFYNKMITDVRNTSRMELPKIVVNLIEFPREFSPQSFISRNYDILRFVEKFLDNQRDMMSRMQNETPALAVAGSEATRILLGVIENFKGLTNPELMFNMLRNFWPRKLSRSGPSYTNLEQLKKEAEVTDHTIIGDGGAFPFDGELSQAGKEILKEADPVVFGSRLAFNRLRTSILLSDDKENHPELGKTQMVLDPRDRLPKYMGEENKGLADIFVSYQTGRRRIKVAVPARYFYDNNFSGFTDHIKAAMDKPENWRTVPIDNDKVKNAFRGTVSPYQQELNRRDPNNYDAADALVVLSDDETTDINVLKNHPDLITTPGSPIVYYLTTKEKHVTRVSSKNGHMVSDGAEAYRDFDKEVNQAIKETKENKKEVADFTEHTEKIISLDSDYKRYHHIETVTIEGDKYIRLMELQKKLYGPLKEATGDDKKEGVKLDLSVIIHFIAMLTANAETAHFLAVDKTTNTPCPAIAIEPERLQKALLSDTSLNKTMRDEMLVAMRLLQFDRQSVAQGEGIAKTFDSISEGIKRVLNWLAKFADPAKKRVLSQTDMMTSLLITQEPYKPKDSVPRNPEENYFTITDFATAHYEEAQDLVVGGLHSEGKITLTFDYAVDENKPLEQQLRGYTQKFELATDKMLDKLEALYEGLKVQQTPL